MPNNNNITLKQIKRKLWLHRLFKRDIPAEHDETVVQLMCCDKAFMQKYVLTHKLSKKAEDLLFDSYLKDDPDMIADYFSRYKIEPENQIKVVESRNVPLIEKLARAVNKFDAHYWELFEAVTKSGNAETVLHLLKQFTRVQWPAVFLTAVELQDADMFEKLIELSKSYSDNRGQIAIDAYCQEALLHSNNQALLEVFFKHNRFSDHILNALLNGSIKTTFDIEKLVAKNIEKTPLHASVLCQLVTQNRRDLLKMYDQIYGLPDNVLAYYVNLKQFRRDVGLKD